MLNNRHRNKALQQDWNENNSNFRCYLVEQTDDRSREQYWTLHFKSNENGYNINIGTKISQKQINDLASIHKGKTVSLETRRKLSEQNKGKKLSIETRNKMSASRKERVSPIKGKNLSIETRQKISKSNMGRPPTKGMTGKTHSIETRKKISEALKQYHNNNNKEVIKWKKQKNYL